MATIQDSSIDELARRSALLEAEARLLRAEAEKSRAERALVDVRRSPFAIDRSMWSLLATAAVLAIALMSIGSAIVALAPHHG